MYDVVALGELLIDFTTQATDADGYPTMAAHPGGAPANFLAAIAKFGGRAALLGKVGTDTFGKLLTDMLRKAGIETKGLVASDEFFTTLAFVTLDENGVSVKGVEGHFVPPSPEKTGITVPLTPSVASWSFAWNEFETLHGDV